MTINFELIVEQSQKLIMTPALQQAIALLQFSTPELQDFIENEMINNPLPFYRNIFDS
jgi:RNA polymerase sigma-54 factor